MSRQAGIVMETAAKRPRVDAVIGLDVAGKLYYCRTSTLTVGGGSSSYFAARFGPSKTLDPEIDRVDANGRNIYFIDRDPDIFSYVLDHLRTNNLPSRLGSFREKSDLWHALRKEAEFFALDGLSSLLKVTYTCSPERDGGKGVLYWLGTDKGSKEYTNPYNMGSVDITGWMDDDTQPYTFPETRLYCGQRRIKGLYIEYMPQANKEDGECGLDTLLPGGEANNENPVVVDLRTNVVSPTHFSLRYGGCCGLQGSWNLEASMDGENWVILHRGTNDDGNKVSQRRRNERINAGEYDALGGLLYGIDGEEERKNEYNHYMERNYRHIWKLDNFSREFFRYFRMIGTGPPDERRCLHAIGLEIYGSVYEN